MTMHPVVKNFADMVEEHLKMDRQWSRHQRIQHAEHQRKIAKTDDERRFWNAIIKRNKD
jgi:hypothetical protein